MSCLGTMMASRARQWKGTPFKWQASVKHVGCDCKGLVAGVLRECGRPEGMSLQANAADYGDPVNQYRLISGLRELFDRADAPQLGDILLLWVRGSPQHLVICTSYGPLRAVQALHTGRKCVVEVGVPRASVHSIWRCRKQPPPGLEEFIGKSGRKAA